MRGRAKAAPAAAAPAELSDIVRQLELKERTLATEIALARKKEVELEAVRAALKAFHASPAPAATGRAAAARSPKKSKRATPAKPARGKKASPLSPDEPRKAKGRMPTVNVQVHACSDKADRKARVVKLREQGFKRAAGGVHLGPGMYDVRETGDGATILWRPKAGES
jgi:hypothetical protein